MVFVLNTPVSQMPSKTELLQRYEQMREQPTTQQVGSSAAPTPSPLPLPLPLSLPLALPLPLPLPLTRCRSSGSSTSPRASR